MDITQKLLTLIPSKEEFITDSYIDEVLITARWCHHGNDIVHFIDDVLLDTDEIKHLANKGVEVITAAPEFRRYFKRWLSLRYDYVLGELKDEISSDTLTLKRAVYLTDEEILAVRNRSKKDVGVYWTTGIPNAYNVAPEASAGKKEYILTAKVRIEDVNWHETLVSRFDYSNGDDEMEINLSEMPLPTITEIADEYKEPIGFAA